MAGAGLECNVKLDVTLVKLTVLQINFLDSSYTLHSRPSPGFEFLLEINFKSYLLFKSDKSAPHICEWASYRAKMLTWPGQAHDWQTLN